MRAAGTPTLDGFNYKTVGMDAMLLEFLEVDGDALEAYVLQGRDDEQIYAWIAERARRYGVSDAKALNHRVLDLGDRNEKERLAFAAHRDERYPGRSDLLAFVDLIEADEGGLIRARPLPNSAYEPT